MGTLTDARDQVEGDGVYILREAYRRIAPRRHEPEHVDQPFVLPQKTHGRAA